MNFLQLSCRGLSRESGGLAGLPKVLVNSIFYFFNAVGLTQFVRAGFQEKAA